ncbi:MAG: alpha/beta hydrolase [Clostridiales bacterium]|nr:alpha/beta hydrolase [Clostridiales bacterium]
MKKGTKRLIAAALGAVTGTAAVKAVHNTSKNLADMAMNRELPETANQSKQEAGKPRHSESRAGAMARPASMICWRKSRTISGSAKDQELENRKNAAADRLRNSEYKTVEITAHDGIRLTGHFHLVENPKRTIIAVHGWRSSWAREFGLIADFLYKNGCNVLYIEQRAHGASDGEYIGFGLLERFDLLEWIDWINTQGNEQENSQSLGLSALPIYLFGLSMGAATVLMTAGESLPENVHGVIADSGYTSPHDEWRHVAENNLHYHYKLMEKYVDKLSMERIGFSSDEYSATQAMQECRTPVLFIHGTDDTFVPIEMTYENYKVCAAPKRLLVVPGAGHCQSYLLEQERYEEELLRFWQEFDKMDAGS